MLTEQQLAFLAPRQKHQRRGEAISVAGVTQVTVADAVGLPQPNVSDVARQRYRSREREEVRRLYFGCSTGFRSRHSVDLGYPFNRSRGLGCRGSGRRVPQPNVSDVARQRYRTTTAENARKFADSTSVAPSRIPFPPFRR